MYRDDAPDIKYGSCYGGALSHGFISPWSGQYCCSCSVFNSIESQAGTVTILDPIITSRTTDILLVMGMVTHIIGADGAMVSLDQLFSEHQPLHQV